MVARRAADALAGRRAAVRGARSLEPAAGPLWRRRSTYLPGSGSRSAGRGAAGALPPSFLLPSPPPRGATHNTRRKRKPRCGDGRQLRGAEPPCPGLVGPAAGSGRGGGEPEARACAASLLGEREPAASGG